MGGTSVIPQLLKPTEGVKMSRIKWNIDLVKQRTNELAKGYKCLSEEYISNKFYLKFKCPKGHIFVASWDNFQRGSRCPYRTEVKRNFRYSKKIEESVLQQKQSLIYLVKKKRTIEEIKKYVKQFGYECLSNEYRGCYDKLKFKCPKGHIFEINWNNFQQGCRCSTCAGNKKLTIEYVKEQIEKEGYECLSDEYVNSKTDLLLRCPEGHEYETTWVNFQQEKRCPTCYRENNYGENHPRWKNYSQDHIKKFKGYRGRINQLTNQNYQKYYYLINPEGYNRGRGKYHIDHIYTVIDGFENSIEPEVIANPTNLQMLTEHDNISKQGRSDITIKKLYRQYYKLIN